MRKVPSLLLPSASHETVGIIYLPLATTTAPRHRSSNRSGGNTSPVEKEADQTNQPTNHAAIAGARQSLAIIQTSLGHSAERGEAAGRVGRYTRQQLYTSLDVYLIWRTSEGAIRSRS